MNTCGQWGGRSAAHTCALSVSLLQTSLRLWILALSCCVSLEISWILSAISSRLWWIWLHCLREQLKFEYYTYNDVSNSSVHVTGSESSWILLDTPTLLERAAPSSPSSSACGCSVWTLCPASWPVLASAGFPQHTSSSAPSASSHTELSGPGAAHSI